jgi:hypothetical protein
MGHTGPPGEAEPHLCECALQLDFCGFVHETDVRREMDLELKGTKDLNIT